jgi:decaprenylphospho-beta-D-ribofuranose 2-oxidase
MAHSEKRSLENNQVRKSRRVKLQGWNLQNSGFCRIEEVPPSEKQRDRWEKGIIRGAGLSYGDASLNFSDVVYQNHSKALHELILQDDGESLLIDARLTIGELCEYLQRTNRFMEVVPGSLNATVGGCIASDVHGKNDKKYGSFGYSVLGMEVITPLGHEWIERNSNLKFRFIIGGYGLTGIINTARIRVRTIPGQILRTKKYLVRDLHELLNTIDNIQSEYEYSVGWIESSQNGFGTGYVEGANWSTSTVKDFRRHKKMKITLPNFGFNMISPTTIAIYNYFTRKIAKRHSESELSKADYREYLFPTLSIKNWNVLFGRYGFHEIQLLIPDVNREKFVLEFNKIAKKYPIFLAGFKKIFKPGLGVLSFTKPGWSVAINIPAKYINKEEVLEIQNYFAMNFGAIQYLTKDSCLDVNTFNVMYPQSSEFRTFREVNGYLEYFESEMSRRLLI